MTREEAITVLQYLKESFELTAYHGISGFTPAFNMAIEALEGGTDSIVIAGDYIEHNGEKYIKLTDVEKCIDRWERQERPKGRWIVVCDGVLKCSECGNETPYDENFCYNCGADMREIENE